MPLERQRPAVAAASPVWRRAVDLLRPERLDLIVKHELFRSRRSGKDTGAESRYRRHIASRTAGFEDGKRSVDDYVDAADRLLAGLEQRGFDPAHPVRLGSANGLPLDGAHRIAAAIALGLDVAVQEVPGTYGGVWDFEWFRENGFERADLEQLLRRYAALSVHPAVFVFWGPCRDRWHELLAALRMRMGVVGWLDLAVAPDTLRVVVDDIYAWRLGPLPNERIRTKGTLLAAGPPVIRVVLAECREHDAPAALIDVKRCLRALAGQGEDDFAATVHAADTPAEARYLAELLLNGDSQRLLAERPVELRPTFEAWLAEYAATLDARGIPREDACVVGSAVLEAIGLRTSTDIDCIVGQREPRFHHGVVSLAEHVDLVTAGYHRRREGAPTHTDAEIVSDPSLHFYVRGLKFALPELVIDRKRQHGRPKDLADVALWERRAVHRNRTDQPPRGRLVAWCEDGADVLQFVRLQQVADAARDVGLELVVAGLDEPPVGATFASILRPPCLAALPIDPVPTAGDAVDVLTAIGVPVSPLLDVIADEAGPAAHPGVTHARLAAASWAARWMTVWMTELAPLGVVLPLEETVFTRLLSAVARHLGVNVRVVADLLDPELPGVARSTANGGALRAVDERRATRTICRHANEAVALLKAAARASRHCQRDDFPDEEWQRTADAMQRRLAQLEVERRLLEWALQPARHALWIWGAGAAGASVLRWLTTRGASVAGLVDSSPAKIGTSIDGVGVSSADVLRKVDTSCLRLVIASMYADEILKSASDLGVARQHLVVWSPAEASPLN